MDSGICQTFAASPAEPGGLPFVLEGHCEEVCGLPLQGLGAFLSTEA